MSTNGTGKTHRIFMRRRKVGEVPIRLRQGGFANQFETLLDDVVLAAFDFARANVLGLAVAASLRDMQIARTRTMGAYKTSPLLDFELGRSLELESMYLEPLRQAQQVGVATPRFGVLCDILRQLDALNFRSQQN